MRGGKREGAGRPAGEPTKRMTIPLSLVPVVTSLLLKHRQEIKQPVDDQAEQVAYDDRLILRQGIKEASGLAEAQQEPSGALVGDGQTGQVGYDESLITRQEIKEGSVLGSGLQAKALQSEVARRRAVESGMLVLKHGLSPPSPSFVVKPKIKNFGLNPAQLRTLRALETMSLDIRRKLIAEFDSLYEAVLVGVTVDFKSGLIHLPKRID